MPPDSRSGPVAAPDRSQDSHQEVTPRLTAPGVNPEAHALLTALGGDGYLSVNWKPRGDYKLKFDILTVPQALRRIDSLGQSADVWYGVNRMAAKPARGRGLAADVTRITCLYADLDTGKTLTPATVTEARTIIDGLPDPAFIVYSGHGLQPIWLLTGDEFTVTSDDSRDELAVLVKRWGQLIADRCKDRGWVTDSVYDLARILRVPGSVNHKYPDKPVPARLELTEGGHLTYEEVAELLDHHERNRPLRSPITASGPAKPAASSQAAREWLDRWHTQFQQPATAYGARTLEGLLGEYDGGARHPWMVRSVIRAVELADAGELDGRTALEAISSKFAGLISDGERPPQPSEFADAVAHAVGQLPARGEQAEQPATPRRYQVKAGNRNPVDVADDVAAHLLPANQPPHLFSMGTAAVVFSGNGTLTPLDGDGWLYYVARRVDFHVIDKDGSPRIVQPPAGAMKLIPSVMLPELPALDGIAATPYLDRQGNVISDNGYHPGTRLILHCDGFQLPAVPAQPSTEDVAQAVKLLMTDWLGDFPFKSDADKANAIAVLLTLTGRMFFALAPLFVFDASTAGSGKGLLVATISLIATGEVPHLMELPADGEEQRKKITSALLAGHELIVWDESHVIAGRTLAAILTAEKYSDRLLGGNKMISVVNRFTQVALGNNVEVWGDMKRRVVPSRLVPENEHPEDRSDFRHPDLQGWVLSHRGELLAAVLTIWRNWIAKGKPSAPAGMGSFDKWARTVGGALQAAGIEGFRANTTGWLSDSEDDDGWGDHLAELLNRFGNTDDGWFTVAKVADAVDAGLLKRPPVRRDPDKTIAELIGYGYRKIRERWHGDLRLIRSEDRKSASGGREWKVCQREERPNHYQDAQHGQDPQPPTDHPDHADDDSGDPQRNSGWPTGSYGEEASRVGLGVPAPLEPRCLDPDCPEPPRRDCETCWDHASLETR